MAHCHVKLTGFDDIFSSSDRIDKASIEGKRRALQKRMGSKTLAEGSC